MDLNSLPDLVFDRASEEAQQMQALINKGYTALTAAEKQQWSQLVHRGSWDFEALNRIIAYINAIVDFAASEEVYVTLQGTWNPNYTGSTLVYKEDVNLLATDITTLRDEYYTPAGWINLNTMEYMTHNEANALEYDLFILWQHVLRVARHEDWIYCGEAFCGEF